MLYEQGNADSRMRQLFVDQVESIHWAYKLSSATVHMQDQEDLKEIQIFRIDSRVVELDQAILTYIDRIVPSPIIFEIIHEGKVKIIASYKRLNYADKSKVVLGQYYASDWLDDTRRIDLPIYLKLSDLYSHFIEQLLPSYQAESSLSRDTDVKQDGMAVVERMEYGIPYASEVQQKPVSIEEKLAKAEQLTSLKNQIARLKTRMNSERQFNRKVELNRQIQVLEKQLLAL